MHRIGLSRHAAVAALISGLVLSGSAAHAAVNLGGGDAIVAGATQVSPAELARGGNDTFTVSVSANEGTISDSNCDGTKNQIATKDTFTVTSGLAVSGNALERDFDCDGGRNFNQSPETLVFADLTVEAGSTAPLGHSDYELTFGSTGALFVVGQQVQLGGSPTWVNPRLYVTVNPRAASDLAAGAGDAHVNLSWTASPDAADITDYEIEVTGGKSATLTAVKEGTSLTDTGLTNGTQYCYRIRAHYSDGTNDFYSAYTPATPVCATPQAPAATDTWSLQFKSPMDQSTGGNVVVNTVKNGRIVPVKVEIFKNDVEQVDGDGNFQITVSPTACESGARSDSTEVYADAGSSSAGTSAFRWSADAPGPWIYNLDTKALNLTTNSCYRVDVYSAATLVSGGQWVILKVVK